MYVSEGSKDSAMAVRVVFWIKVNESETSALPPLTVPTGSAGFLALENQLRLTRDQYRQAELWEVYSQGHHTEAAVQGWPLLYLKLAARLGSV